MKTFWNNAPKVWDQKPKAIVAEVVLVVVLSLAWMLSYFGVESTLDSLSPAGRALFLVNWFTNESLVVSFVLVAIAIGIIPFRHVSPFGALVAASVCITAAQWWYPFTNSVVQFMVLGLLTAWASWKTRKWWWVLPVLVFPIAAISIRMAQVTARFEAINSSPSTTLLSVSGIVQEILLFVLAIGIGLGVRLLEERSAELKQRNEELEAERANTAAAAVVGERLRISRELHDVVAHHVTTMTVHAGAARQLIGSAPDKATESLLHIESAGRSAVNELHQLLGFLRGDQVGDDGDGDASISGDRAPTPSLRHLDQLRESVAGELECTFAVEGDLSRIPTAVDLSAFRIVQEALTNTMKHSSAATAHVDIKVQKAALELSVTDQGGRKVWAASSGDSAKTDGGHGVVGMRERASLHGGQLEVGPDTGPDGGWRVHAVLPFGNT